MKNAPPLNADEEVVFDHIPHMGSFKRAAMFLIAVSLVPTVAFTFAFPDSYWVIVPLFVTCVLLTQERFTMGRHRAWVTTQRIIMQTAEIPLDAINSVTAKSVYVKVAHSGDGKSTPLYYPKDAAVLMAAIQTSKEAKQHDD